MIIARAPVRISFGGGGTDLAAYYESYGGFVVSAAITRYCYVVANATADGSIRINSADYRVWERYDPGDLPPVAEPLVLPKAAIEWFANRNALASGLDLFLSAEVPPGTGLGSSSAMTVALIQALAAHTGTILGSSDVAELACAIEIERLRKPIGKQDQYASTFGGLNTIEFTRDGVIVEPLGLRPDVVAALSERLLLFSTGHSRDSATILEQQRADTTARPPVIASLHRLKALAARMCAALVAEHLDQFGALLDLAWREKRGLGRNVSSAAIDRYYAAARAAGALGGKITGAGGGGFLLLYCPPAQQARLRHTMRKLGLPELPFDVDWAGAHAFQPDRLEQLPLAANRTCVPAWGSAWNGREG